jgi:hypothetical protein
LRWAVDPVVTLGTGTRPTFQLRSVTDRTNEFGLSGAAAVEGEWPVLAEIVDEAGNVASDLSVGTVVLDFTEPSVLVADDVITPTASNPLRAPEHLGLEAAGYTVVFNTDEPLSELPVVEARCTTETASLTREIGETSQTLFTYHLEAEDLTVKSPIVVRAVDAAIRARRYRLASNSITWPLTSRSHSIVRVGLDPPALIVSSRLCPGNKPLSEPLERTPFTAAYAS